MKRPEAPVAVGDEGMPGQGPAGGGRAPSLTLTGGIVNGLRHPIRLCASMTNLARLPCANQFIRMVSSENHVDRPRDWAPEDRLSLLP